MKSLLPLGCELPVLFLTIDRDPVGKPEIVFVVGGITVPRELYNYCEILNPSSSLMRFSTFAIPWHNETGSRRK